jgi:hypothetical protein
MMRMDDGRRGKGGESGEKTGTTRFFSFILFSHIDASCTLYLNEFTCYKRKYLKSNAMIRRNGSLCRGGETLSPRLLRWI